MLDGCYSSADQRAGGGGGYIGGGGVGYRGRYPRKVNRIWHEPRAVHSACGLMFNSN